MQEVLDHRTPISLQHDQEAARVTAVVMCGSLSIGNLSFGGVIGNHYLTAARDVAGRPEQWAQLESAWWRPAPGAQRRLTYVMGPRADSGNWRNGQFALAHFIVIKHPPPQTAHSLARATARFQSE